MRTDGRTDIVAYRNFTSAPNKIVYRETVILCSKDHTKT